MFSQVQISIYVSRVAQSYCCQYHFLVTEYAKSLRAVQLIIVNTLVCYNKKPNFGQVNVLMSNPVTSV